MASVITYEDFLNQARAAEGHVHLVSRNCFGLHVCMCVCLSVCLCVCPEGTNNQWHDMVWYRTGAIG